MNLTLCGFRSVPFLPSLLGRLERPRSRPDHRVLPSASLQLSSILYTTSLALLPLDCTVLSSSRPPAYASVHNKVGLLFSCLPSVVTVTASVLIVDSMEEPGISSAHSRQPAFPSQADATVHITTRSPAPVSEAAAKVDTAKYHGSCAHQQSSSLGLEELKLPAVVYLSHTADASQHAAVELAADSQDADLQHTSNMQEYDSLSAQDDMGIAAASDGPAFAQTSSDGAQQQESSIVIDNVETMAYIAEQTGTGVSMPPDTAFSIALESNATLFDPPDLMETSYGFGEHEASLCCLFLAHQVYKAPDVMQTNLVPNVDGCILVKRNADKPRCRHAADITSANMASRCLWVYSSS